MLTWQQQRRRRRQQQVSLMTVQAQRARHSQPRCPQSPWCCDLFVVCGFVVLFVLLLCWAGRIHAS